MHQQLPKRSTWFLTHLDSISAKDPCCAFRYTFDIRYGPSRGSVVLRGVRSCSASRSPLDVLPDDIPGVAIQLEYVVQVFSFLVLRRLRVAVCLNSIPECADARYLVSDGVVTAGGKHGTTHIGGHRRGLKRRCYPAAHLSSGQDTLMILLWLLKETGLTTSGIS